LQSANTIHPGLSSAEVAERVARGETNTFKIKVGRSYWEIVRDNVFNLFNIVLLVLLIIVFIFKDYRNLFFPSFSVIFNALIGMIQEINAKRTLDRLAALAVHDVKVWRDAKLIDIPIGEVVKDDVMPIEPGDRLVVDGLVLSSDGLELDESLLTGESDAISKEVNDPMYSGSFCIAGSGLMRATQVGAKSTVNKLSEVAKSYRNVQTPTQVKVGILVEFSVLGMLVLGPMVMLAGYIAGLELLDIVRNAVVLVTSLVPQGLVLVTTLSLTLGAVKISRRQTLVQRINAVESLASADVLCFDKTGTLTRNQLVVTEIIPLNGQSPDEICKSLAIYTRNLAHLNKTAGAIADYCGKTSDIPITKKQEIPFTSARKWGAIVLPEQTLVLGAPERVLITSTTAVARAKDLASAGQRVLALAGSDNPPQNGKLDDACQPLALIVMSDQVREDIRETLNAFRQQNVQLKVISGDNVETVRAIAAQAGMHITGGYTGEELEAMSPSELEVAVRDSNLFARIEPETKRKIIAALKRQGHYVAMVGDGVNDVPALKESNLAIAMNDGAQIAKDIADIVLLNNAMSTLPLAFAEGKSITQKIYGTAKMFLVKNIYSVLLFIFVGFMMMPFPISPIQISWAVFGTINVPTTLMAFGVLRPSFMRNFARDVLSYVVISGIVGALGLTSVYGIVYIVTEGNIEGKRDIARSAVTLFMILYSIQIFWHTHGIDIFQPKTFTTYGKETLFGILLAVATIAVPYVQPDWFGFVRPSAVIWLVIAVTFAFTIYGLRITLQNQHIFNSLRRLSAE
jgi:cation-transporting ATPase E